MTTQKISYMNAIRDGIAEEMRHDPTVITMGEGIAERGGSYGHTRDLWKEFGDARVIDTPISELGFTGMAVGAAATGLKPIVDIMFADILYEIMSALCQQASKLTYMSCGRLKIPMVIRAQMGGRTTGPHHSGCLYPLLMHVPGHIVVVPSNPYEAKGLIKSAIRNPNTVVFFEHKFAYAEKGEVPIEKYTIPLGKANVVREGTDVTIVAISTMVGKSLRVAESGDIGASIEVIDPRTLYPLDMDTILKSVMKTGRLIIVEEAHITCNAGAEIASQAVQTIFKHLRAPIVRVASLPIPHPYAPVLEAAMVPNEQKIRDAVRQVMELTIIK